ncbi:hypothetical protein ABIE67_009625 [Streptomyces sp. V4I8]|uniref:hypothetical protein n=1 Tax=Streptomyces sp. V4I8 TaxID=3156469 RepID=UPI003512A97C
MARTKCLRRLRAGSLPVDNAAYWLATHLEKWAGESDQTAPERLNVSSKYFAEAKEQGARSDERKVSTRALTLTTQDKVSLGSVLEELIRRLHLVESGLDPGDYLDLTDWPTS